MKVGTSYQQVLELAGRVAADLIAARDELTSLDAAVGDGDLGRTIERGFTAIQKILVEAVELEPDVGKFMCQAGKAFANAGSSSFGALMGTGLMSAGLALKGKPEVSAVDVCEALDRALQALMERSGAQVNDKTLLDALYPALRGIRTELERSGNSADLARVIGAGALAAHQGAENTRGMQSRIGRASWLGERSIGHVDPGARAIDLMFASAARHLRG